MQTFTKSKTPQKLVPKQTDQKKPFINTVVSALADVALAHGPA